MANVPMKYIEDLKDSTELLKDPKKLQKRADDDGALYFSNFLDKVKVLELRKIIMETCDKHNWIKKEKC